MNKKEDFKQIEGLIKNLPQYKLSKKKNAEIMSALKEAHLKKAQQEECSSKRASFFNPFIILKRATVFLVAIALVISGYNYIQKQNKLIKRIR